VVAMSLDATRRKDVGPSNNEQITARLVELLLTSSIDGTRWQGVAPIRMRHPYKHWAEA
jgi:hypothetical protein